MKKFAGAIFGGYKKQDVDDYIGFLEEELHKLNQNTISAIDEKNKEIEQLKSESAYDNGADNRDLIASREALADKDIQLADKDNKLAEKDNQLADLERKLAEQKALYNEQEQRLFAIRSQLSETENKLSSVTNNNVQDKDILELYQQAQRNIKDYENGAKIRSDRIEAEARMNADKVMREAKINADVYRDQVEEEVRKKIDEVKVSRYDFYEFLVSLRQSEKMLIDAYNSLGEKVNQLPGKIDAAINNAGELDSLLLDIPTQKDTSDTGENGKTEKEK